MIRAIEDHREGLDRLCRAFGVRRLELFGSAASEEDRFDPDRSDIDFLVEFDLPDPACHAKAYFGLLAALKDLFSRAMWTWSKSRP